MSRLMFAAVVLVLAGLLNGCIVIHQIAPNADGESVLVLANKGLVQSVYSCSGTIGGYECTRLFKAQALAEASVGSSWEDDTDSGSGWDRYSDERDEDRVTEDELEAARARRREMLQHDTPAKAESGTSGRADGKASEPSDARTAAIEELREQLDAAGITDDQVRRNMINGALRSKGLAELSEDESP
jgi:hypothetical protein